MFRLAVTAPISYIRAWWKAYQTQAPSLSPLLYSIYGLPHSPELSWHFFSLAGQYEVYVVAGKDSLHITTSAPLYNLCVVYQPNGRSFSQLVQKVFLTQEEQAFIQPGRTQTLPTFLYLRGNWAC